MAVIKKLDEIKHLIPDVDYRQFGSPVSNVDEKTKDATPLYAFMVTKNGNVIVSVFRVEFTVVKRLTHTYLLVCTYLSEYGDYMDFAGIENSDKNITKEDWPFEEDEIGLRLNSDNFEKCYIYFGTKHDDVDEIRTKTRARKEIGAAKVVEAETVFV